ncbi:right-handed parallel beta-helix repeat-containing protein [Spirosoma sp. SC4-14]|uniref:right-handed parallel beta-helix repeat-containing protein n=1 Tax=Spirosoma sp. SC4-14 TaxID=3128900 RepID=UPI0030D4920E
MRLTLFLFLANISWAFAQLQFYVSPNGQDTNPGTLSKPFATIEKALSRVKTAPSTRVQINLRKGTYYLSAPIRISPDLTAGKALSVLAYPGEKVYLSGGRRLHLTWTKKPKGVWTATISGDPFEQLFVNGKQQILARYPNYNAQARVFNGTSADAISEDRISHWKNPVGGYVHVLHQHEWGDMHYRIAGKENGHLDLEGGWQNNRPAPMHARYRFVENIAEELDAPGEWFYDNVSHTLSFIPPAGVDPRTATIEVSRLKDLVELTGTPTTPLKEVRFDGIRFVHTERTFMEVYEPLLRSDWMIYRGAAVLLAHTENCFIENCEFTNLGGNAVFLSGYNRNSGIRGSHIHHIGASGICFVGDTSAVRSPAFRYEQFVPYEKLDRQAGPKTDAYPAQCTAEDNLIHHIGQIEKQSAGVQMSIASGIVVRHNSIYQVPRAGINIGDGTWGGHVLEFNDVFDTVLETGDHGAFNSWGRDRYWHPSRDTMDSLVSVHPELILLDAQQPTIIRNNRFRCDHGWDIDLDDGSSNYYISNNVCLNGGLKLREGFKRVVENNILINNSFHPHVWFKNDGDNFRRNIVMRPYAPIGIHEWGKEIDYNLFPNEAALQKAQANGTDKHSLFGDPRFRNPALGNYQVGTDSPALQLGFQNFPMNQFGVQKPALRTLAQTPRFPALLNAQQEVTVRETTWLGVSLRNVQGLGDRSAYGLPDEKGIVVVAISPQSPLATSGLKKGDVIRMANNDEMASIGNLMAIQQQVNWTGHMTLTVIRNQQRIRLTVPLK